MEKNKKSYWINANLENSDRGIYAVAYGKNARTCAQRLVSSARKYMPDIPIAIASAESLGIEDYHISCPDLDLGGRYAKIEAYNLAPKQWKYVLNRQIKHVVSKMDNDLYVVKNMETGEQIVCNMNELIRLMSK